MALAPAAVGAQTRGGSIRIGMDADTTTMDPHRSTAAVDRQVYNNVYAKLVDIDARFAIVPQLAQSGEIKNGGAGFGLQPRPRREVPDCPRFNSQSRKWELARK